MLIDAGNHHWMEHGPVSLPPGRPALFLDRDGVVVEEVNYLRRVEDVRLIPGIGPAIADVNRAGVSVNLVTNQSGIGRGMYGWDAFSGVQAEIMRRLAADGARFDCVLACGASPQSPELSSTVPWRKPGPGMVLEVRQLLAPDPSRSFIIGDRASDLAAGRDGGLAGGWLVRTGYGAEAALTLAQDLQPVQHFAVRHAVHAVDAIGQFLALVA